MATRRAVPPKKSTINERPSTPATNVISNEEPPSVGVKTRKTAKIIEKNVIKKSATRLGQSSPTAAEKQPADATQIHHQYLEIVQQQTAAIHDIKTQLEALRKDNVNTQELLREIKRENNLLQHQIKQQNETIQSQSKHQLESVRSYASALQTPTNLPPSGHPQRTQEPSQNLVLTINAVRTKKELKEADKVKVMLQDALNDQESTKDVQIQGLQLLEGPRIQILLATKDNCKAARINTRWLEKSLPGARLNGETWYHIKIDGVYKNQVTKENETGDNYTFKDNILETFSQDNAIKGIEMKAMKITWLSKRSSKWNGSLLIWLTQKEAVDCLLRQQVVRFGPTIAQPCAYESRAGPERCYKCNQYGHRQFRCKEQAICGICAGKHFTNDCKNQDNPRCAACQGPHTVMDRGCPVYRKHNSKATEDSIASAGIERSKEGEQSKIATKPKPTAKRIAAAFA